MCAGAMVAIVSGVGLLFFSLEAAPAAARELPIESRETRELYCRYKVELERTIHSVNRDMGANPNEGVQVGEVITLKGEATMAPSLPSRASDLQSNLRFIASLTRIPPGNTIAILKRIHDSRGNLQYFARWREAQVVGFIHPTSLSWLNDDQMKLFAHMDAHEEELDRRMETIEAQLFAPNGLQPHEVLIAAATGGWDRNCR